MSVFSSERERRLWIFAFAVVIAIYASLPFAGQLADVLRASDLLEISFAAGMLLIVLMVIAHALQSRPNAATVTIALGVIAAYLLVFVRIANPAERTHLIEYGVVSLLTLEALRERARNGRFAPAPALLAIVIATTVGTIDEFVQGVLPGRVFDTRDILFNALAGILAVAASLLLEWARRQVRK